MSTTTDAPGASTRLVPGITNLEWEAFRDYFSRAWQVGEHTTFLGHTGSGKTTMAVELLAIRSWVVAIGTKPKDDTLERLIREQKWKRVVEWDQRPEIRHEQREQRLVLWPKYSKLEDRVNLRDQVARGLAEMFSSGSWTVFADELAYLCKSLGLEHVLHEYWTQGRSIGLTLVGGTQRPRHVPLEAYSQATHLFVWKDNDAQNVKRLSELGGLRSQLVKATVPRLPKHTALYMNTRTGEMATVTAPAPK